MAECGPVQTYADAEALINDPRVLACRITDNGEPLVNARTVPLACDTTRKGVQELSDNPFQLRTSALDRLVCAQELLRTDISFRSKRHGGRSGSKSDCGTQVSVGCAGTGLTLRARNCARKRPVHRAAGQRAAAQHRGHRRSCSSQRRRAYGHGIGIQPAGCGVPHRASGRRRCPPLPRHPWTGDERGRVHQLPAGVVALVLWRSLLGLPNLSRGVDIRPAVRSVPREPA